MSSHPKRIAVIGAGASGLTGIKCCLDEGLKPVCLEKSDNLGGLWRYSKDVQELGRATVMRSTIINTSKETMAYSDFPPPSHFPIYMHHSYVLKYLQLYGEKFDLLKYIRFSTEVLKIEESDDFESSGQWKVYIKDLTNGQTRVEIFDGILVCNGHHAFPNIPHISGQERFKGQILHSQQYKHSKNYEDKEVVVVGIGNSGVDIAVELSTVSSQVYLSTRRGAWILNRVFDKGFPIDMSLTKRSMKTIQSIIPVSVLKTVSEYQLNKRFDHNLYGLKPDHAFLSQHPTVNDDLPNRIISGRVQIKPDIKELSENGVHFVDGTYKDADVLILATGYQIKFPFIPKSVIDIQNNKVQFFKYMFPPDQKRNTLAIIGLAQPLGAIMPISELQCRIATRVFKGEITLPSTDKMRKEIIKKEEVMTKRYVKSSRHTIQVDFIQFMDELAELCGCKPNLWKMLLVDPFLALFCFFSACTPYQYRLVGPGKWKGAKEALYGQWDRTISGLNAPKTPTPDNATSNFFWVAFVFLVGAFLLKVIF